MERRRTHLLASASAVAEPGTSRPVDVAVAVAHPELPSPDTGRCVNNYTSFTEQYRIRGYEAGPDQRANIITMANLLQEVGGNHGVATWGRSDSGLAAMPGLEHLVFVATRMQIRMESYPKWGDIVQLETYYAEEGRVMVRRDWCITDAATGHQLGAATSTWVTINSTTRKLAKLPEQVRAKFLKFSPSPPRHVLPIAETRRKLPDFLLPAAYQGPEQVARRTDMDANGHINNVTYLAWAMETVPADVWATWQLCELEIDFKAECHQGDSVQCLGRELYEHTVTPSSNGASSSSSNGASSNGASASSSNGNGASSNGSYSPSKRQFQHSLRKQDGNGGTVEVWQARTSWTPKR